MNNQKVTYSDAIDELQACEIDNTKPEQNINKSSNKSQSENILSEWQRQAIIDSTNVYPLMNQTASLINQYTQQIVNNSVQSTQSQIDDYNCRMRYNVSYNQNAVYTDLESIKRMLNEVKREYNNYKEINGNYPIYNYCPYDKD